MKKTRTDAKHNRKSALHVQRETLRTLSDSALAGIVGGDEDDEESTAVVLDNGSGGAP